MGDDNNLYFIPFEANQVLRLDTSNLQTSLVGEEYKGECKWMGDAKGKDGVIYGVPCYHERILQIAPMTIIGTKEGNDDVISRQKSE